MQKPIFRKVAVERLASPDQVDQLMQVTHARGWLALGAIVAIIAAALVWGIVGSIPTQINGEGILIATGGINTVEAPEAGKITKLYVTVGQHIGANEEVAEFTTETGQTVPILSSYRGRVTEITVDAGSLVDRGTRLLTLVDDEQPLEAVIYLSPTDGKRVAVGRSVLISPATIAKEEYGYVLGTVTSVGELPSTYEGMFRVLKNEDLVNELRAGGAPVEVRVTLTANSANFSGYQWTSPRGPDVKLMNGTPATALINIDSRRPLSLVLPFLK